MNEILNAIDPGSHDRVLRNAEISKLLGGEDQKNYDIDISIGRPYYERRAINILLELAVLAYLMRKLRLPLVFRTGPHLGHTTRLFALDSASDGKILSNAGQPCSVGDYYHTLESHRIYRFFRDGHIFDFLPW